MKLKFQLSKYRYIIISFLILFILIIAVWRIPQLQVGNSPLNINEKARIDAETSARSALIQGIGGLLFFATATVSWLNLKTTQRSVLVSEEKQATERFSKAVEMLGDQNSIYIRLGGIHALERIANDSLNDYEKIIEILISYIKEKTKIESKEKPYKYEQMNPYYEQYEYDHDSMYDDDDDPIITTPNQNYIHPVPSDIQAAITALGRRSINKKSKNLKLDLSRADLRGVIFSGDFSGFDFSGAQLEHAEFKDVVLSRTNFSKVNLNSSKFSNVDFSKSTLENLHISWVKFDNVSFHETKLGGVNFIKSEFINCDLKNSDLESAHFWDSPLCAQTVFTLKYAILKDTKFTNIDLRKINLEGMDLKGLSFTKCCLERAKLSKSNLESPRFEESQMANVDLSESKITFGNFDKSDMSCTNLRNTYFEDTMLTQSNLKGANLEGASFFQCDLSFATLSEANTKNTKFTESILRRTDFRDTNNITLEQISLAKNTRNILCNSDLAERLNLPTK